MTTKVESPVTFQQRQCGFDITTTTTTTDNLKPPKKVYHHHHTEHLRNILMIRKRTNDEDDGVLDDNEDDSNFNNNNKLISCEHVVKFKNESNGFEVYRKLFKLYIMSNNSSFKKIKASLWHCYHNSCKGVIFPSRLHACMSCQYTACYTRKHIHQHFMEKKHNIAMDTHHGYVYCFICDNYIFDEHFESIANSLRRNAMVQNNKFPYRWEPNNLDEAMFHTFSYQKFNTHKGLNGLRGLINLGSTCFMNCIVQTLVHTQPLRDYFLGDRHICRRESSKCLVCEMSQLVQEFYSGKSTPHIPVKLLHLVWTHAKHLAGYEQQDAHEFFISTLDILHRHSSEAIDGCTGNKKCNCIIDKIFTGSLQSDLVCQACGGVSSVVDPIWDFSLDLGTHTANMEHFTRNLSSKNPKSLSLNDCLELFTRTEHLGSSAKIKCNKCQSYQESTKQLSLKTLPIVVSFHLKRFEQANRLNKKVSTFVSFPTNIDMTPYTTSVIGYQARMNAQDIAMPSPPVDPLPSPPPLLNLEKDNSYSLFAVVNHSGTLETGHYTVFVKSNNKWFKCDDHFVMNATESEVLNSEGYLLFYQKNRYEYEYN